MATHKERLEIVENERIQKLKEKLKEHVRKNNMTEKRNNILRSIANHFHLRFSIVCPFECKLLFDSRFQDQKVESVRQKKCKTPEDGRNPIENFA